MGVLLQMRDVEGPVQTSMAGMASARKEIRSSEYPAGMCKDSILSALCHISLKPLVGVLTD